MSTPLIDTKRTLSTGDLVISVSEIFDRLQTKIDPDTLEAILRDIISGHRKQVRPGELITADLMNQILAQLESLEVRVAKLEAGVGTTGGNAPALITSLVPATAVRLDHDLEIHGLNFGFSKGAHRVTIDNVAQNEFVSGSDDLLVVKVRNIANVPSGGKPTQVVVSNGIPPPATRDITILPVEDVGGTVDINIGDPNPATIVSGSTAPVIFNCNMTSQATSRTTFTVTPDITGVTNKSDWLSRIEIMDSTGKPVTAQTFDLAPLQSKNFIVRLSSVPAGTDRVRFTLSLRAASGNAVGTKSREFVVGEQTVPEDDANIPTLGFDSISPTGAINPAHDTITLAAGNAATVTLRTEFATPGDYTVTLAFDTGMTNWVAGLNEPIPEAGASKMTATYRNIQVPSGGRTPKNPEFSIRPNSGASASGGITLKINRVGSSLFKTIKFNLVGS